jgi:hypothetical protein
VTTIIFCLLFDRGRVALFSSKGERLKRPRCPTRRGHDDHQQQPADTGSAAPGAYAAIRRQALEAAIAVAGRAPLKALTEGIIKEDAPQPKPTKKATRPSPTEAATVSRLSFPYMLFLRSGYSPAINQAYERTERYMQ